MASIRINELSGNYPARTPAYMQPTSTPTPEPPTPPGPEPPSKPKVYGFHVDSSISDPSNAVTYVLDAIGMTPAGMGKDSFDYGSWADAFFMPKPCMLRYDGTVAYYLNPTDYTKKVDGSDSDVADTTFAGNAMMEWPLIWYKFVNDTEGTGGYFYVSNYQVDSDYVCHCNRDSADNIIPHFYTSIYNCNHLNGVMRSMSGQLVNNTNGFANTTMEQDVTYATNLNVGDDVEWYIDVYCDRQLINALLVLIGKSLNGQAIVGIGQTHNTPSSGTPTLIGRTGNLNDKGLFYGNLSARDYIKVFGMENWWGGMRRRIAGFNLLRLTDGTETVYQYVKLTYGTSDGSTGVGYNNSDADIIASTYLSKQFVVNPRDNMLIKRLEFDDLGYTIGSIETPFDGSLYYCDIIACNIPSTSSSSYTVLPYTTYTVSRTDESLAYLNMMGPFSGYFNENKDSIGVSTLKKLTSTGLSCKPLASRFG